MLFDDVQLATTVKQLVRDNEATIIANVKQNGVLRKIGVLTTTKLTPPQSFYYVLIEVPLSEEVTEDNLTFRKYTLRVTVGDYATTTPGDKNLYEDTNNEFRGVTNRLIDVITTGSLVSDDGTKFRIDTEKAIRKNDASTITPINNKYHTVMAAIVEIGVKQLCS